MELNPNIINLIKDIDNKKEITDFSNIYIGKSLALILSLSNVKSVECDAISNKALKILKSINVETKFKSIDDNVEKYISNLELEIENASIITEDPSTALFMAKRRITKNILNSGVEENPKHNLTGEDIDMFNERKYEEKKYSSSSQESLCDTHWDGA